VRHEPAPIGWQSPADRALGAYQEAFRSEEQPVAAAPKQPGDTPASAAGERRIPLSRVSKAVASPCPALVPSSQPRTPRPSAATSSEVARVTGTTWSGVAGALGGIITTTGRAGQQQALDGMDGSVNVDPSSGGTSGACVYFLNMPLAFRQLMPCDRD
jgi:hypothetical protein